MSWAETHLQALMLPLAAFYLFWILIVKTNSSLLCNALHSSLMSACGGSGETGLHKQSGDRAKE